MNNNNHALLRMRRGPVLVLALLLSLAVPASALLIPTTAPTAAAEPGEPGGPGEEPRPNVVLITADDMRADDISVMPHTRALVGELELTDFVSNHPLCCPARAELLTGQFGHNNGVHHNLGQYGGYAALLEKDNILSTWFDDAGYATSLAGKYINGWGPTRWGPPTGWDRASVLRARTYGAYGFTMWREGETISPSLHNNDAVTSESVRQIQAGLAEGSPVFHWASYTSPHTSEDLEGKWLEWPEPATRHARLFSRVRPPSEGEPGYAGKPSQQLVKTHRMRLRSLQSVDEGVRDIVAAVTEAGELEDTVFVFTSDNGYMLGEHGLRGKNVPYEESLRVPLLASGPGIEPGRSAKGAMITDIPTSLAALAGVTPGRPQDGRSDLFALDGGWTQVLVQGGNDDERLSWWWRGVREAEWVYIRFVDRSPMLFNRLRDPHQVRNLAGRRPEIEQRLRESFPEVHSVERRRQVAAPRTGEAAR